MSRIGKKPISIPKGVKIDVKDNIITVSGPKGTLSRNINPRINIKAESDQLILSINDSTKELNSYHGLFRALIANMVAGVSKGFERVLEIVGVGYRAELSGRTATFHLGFSHPVVYELPKGIEANIDKTKITLTGIDRELLGLTVAKIRGFRSPEPYKGKGIRNAGEVIKLKAGKTGTK
jgi:large subunit ribosomal protein L6